MIRTRRVSNPHHTAQQRTQSVDHHYLGDSHARSSFRPKQGAATIAIVSWGPAPTYASSAEAAWNLAIAWPSASPDEAFITPT